MARIINAYPPVTNQVRIDLGLNPRNNSAAPIPAPTEAPAMEVVLAFGRTLKLKLHPIHSSLLSPTLQWPVLMRGLFYGGGMG